ncbi:uncharacterized protein LOC144632462 isoform X2 [Oculina patagonica]
MELYERMQERTHREYHKDPRRDIFANGAFHDGISTAADSDENLAHKKGLKEHSSVYTFVWTLLFAVVLIVENIFHFKLFENCQASIVFYWLESCVIALFFRFWGRKRVRSFRSQVSYFGPLLFLHVAVVTAFGLDFNTSPFGLSAGSESYLVALALTPPIVLIASWVTNQHYYSDKIIILVTTSSSLLMVLFCTFEDEHAHYRMSFSRGAFGIIMGASLAFFIVHAKRSLPKASYAELLYMFNFSCVMSLPFVALLFGELPLIEGEIQKRGALKLIFSIFIVAILRLASQAACLYHLKYSTPLLNATVRGFSWIWITIAITFITPGITAELVVPVLSSFWIYGFASFLPALFSDFPWK